MANGTKMNPYLSGVILVGLVAVMLACSWFVKPGLNWMLVIASMIVFLLVLGVAITGRPLGVLVNEQRIMSLSRFQIVIWTLIVISGWLVIAVARVKEQDVANPLAIVIDWQVWALLGISAASFVGSPIANSNKKHENPKPAVLATAGLPFQDDAQKVDAERVGVLYPNRDIWEAKFTDMFQGEELTDATLIDMAKVQMFFFTVVVALAYSAELLHIIAVDDLTIDEISLPKIHEGLLALMGISHAGYLGSNIPAPQKASDLPGHPAIKPGQFGKHPVRLPYPFSFFAERAAQVLYHLVSARVRQIELVAGCVNSPAKTKPAARVLVADDDRDNVRALLWGALLAAQAGALP